MARRSSSEADNSRAEDVAAYVETMARELKGMVEPHGMPTLAYLLDLVRLEASTPGKAAQKEAPSDDQINETIPAP